MSDLSTILNAVTDDLKQHNQTTRRYQRMWLNPKSNGWETYGKLCDTEAELLREPDSKGMYYQTTIASFDTKEK